MRAGTAGVKMAMACRTMALASIVWAFSRLWKTYGNENVDNLKTNLIAVIKFHFCNFGDFVKTRFYNVTFVLCERLMCVLPHLKDNLLVNSKLCNDVGQK